MSSTNRGGQRSAADYYPTPHWCIRRLLEEVALPEGLWAEPCAGSGDIIQAVNACRPGTRWLANELRPECQAPLSELVGASAVSIGDTLHWSPPERPAVSITNPPFRVAMDMVAWSLQHADVAVHLLRLNFVGSASRAPFMRANPPDIYVLPDRPSFTGRGTDSVEYAWFVWNSTSAPASRGHLRVLAPTPAAERRMMPRPSSTCPPADAP